MVGDTRGQTSGVSAQTLNNPAHATALLATRRVIESGPVGSAHVPGTWALCSVADQRLTSLRTP